MAEQRAAVDRLAVTRRWMEVAPKGDWVTGMRDEEQIARMQAFLDEHATPDIEIEASPERITVWRKYPFPERDAILSFDPRTYEYEKNRSLLGETARG